MSLATTHARWGPPAVLAAGATLARLGLALAAAERGRLAPWLAIALGIGIGAYFALPFEPDAAWRWAALPPLLLACALIPRAPHLAWAAGLPAAAALGAALASWHAARAPPMPDLPRGAVILSGTVERVDLLPEGMRVTLRAPSLDGGEALARHLRVRLRNTDPAAPQPGDRLSVRALVRAPMPPAHPGAWDFQRAAWFSGLGGSGFAIGPAEVAPGARAPPPFAALRAAIEAEVNGAMPGPIGAVAAALLTGGQSAIPEADLAALRDSGLAHILSVSGLHVTIVMGLTFGVLRLLLAAVPALALRLPVKGLAAAGALGAGLFYMLLTGSQVPMQRSVAMAALATLALLTGRRALTMRAWALAFALVLLLDPAAMLGPSFQMSFAAVAALIAGWEWLRPRVEAVAPRPGGGASRWAGWRRGLLLGLFGIVATSVLAGAATTPFGLHHFGRFQFYGMAANALAVPVVSFVVMPAGMVAGLAMPLGLEGLPLAVMGLGVEVVLWVAHWVAGWPGAAASARPIPAWGLAVTAFGMVMLCLWRGPALRQLGLPLIALGMLGGATAAAPDLLVAQDGRLIALRSAAGEVFLQRSAGASKLTLAQWLRLQGVEAATPLPPEGAAADGAIRCTPGACRFRPRPGAGEALLLRGDGPPGEAACRRAAVVVSAEPVRARRCAAPVVDRFTVWRHGAHAIWLLDSGGARVLSDRALRGARPWVPPEPRPPGAPATTEPPAATE